MRITKFYQLLILLGLIALVFNSCKKPKNYSPIPEINHVSTNITQGKDTLGNPIFKVAVSFSFVDGDGDLGLSPSDTTGEFGPGKDYYYNLKFAFYEKKNGVFNRNESIKPYYRFQNISKSQTTNKVLKGDMLIEIDLSTTIQYADTTKFTYFIYDRALNKSNIEETNELFLYD